MLATSYREIKQQGYEYKGYVTENFVQQKLAALGYELWWSTKIGHYKVTQPTFRPNTETYLVNYLIHQLCDLVYFLLR